MGYVRGFMHGAVIGTVVGLCVAPQTGEKTRNQLISVGHAAQSGYRQAEKAVRSIQARGRQEEPTLTASITHNNHH